MLLKIVENGFLPIAVGQCDEVDCSCRAACDDVCEGLCTCLSLVVCPMLRPPLPCPPVWL